MSKRFVVLIFFAWGLVISASAQSGPLPIGTVTNVGPGTCSGDQWISGSGVTCSHSIVNCAAASGVASLGMTYAYEGPTSPEGTIVFFSDGDGTTPTGSEDTSTCTYETCHSIKDYAGDYSAHYEVVQTAWDTTYNGNPADGWEDPTSGSGGSVGDAACRPATFIAYIRFGSGTNPPLWSKGGMCVQGESAGGAAAVFPMAWYGAGSGTGQNQNYIDKLSLLSSPSLSDIAQGCYYNNGVIPAPTEVCPSGQLGCNTFNSPPSWYQNVQYSGDGLGSVRGWAGDNNCGGPYDTNETEGNNWRAMSIVDGNIGTFSYPSTNITGWLCSSVVDNGAMNNSSPEAQLFFAQFTSSSQYEGLTINGVSGCGNAEEVGSGIPPSNYGVTYGWQAIEQDMEGVTNGCVSHHGQ